MRHRFKFALGITLILVLLLAAACSQAAEPTQAPEQVVVTQVVEREVTRVVEGEQVEVTRIVEVEREAETPEPEVDEGRPIRIGASLPLTGRRTEGGSAAKQGYDVWVSLVNEQGGMLGRPVELVVLDNASDPDTAVSDYEKLVTVDNVDLLVGPFSSALVFPSAAVAEKYGYAFPEPAGGAPNIFERCFSVLFFAQPASAVHTADGIVHILEQMPEDQRPQTVAYPHVDDPFYVGWIGSAREQLEAMGLETVYFETFPLETTDFSSIALGIRSADADLLVGGLNYQTGVDSLRAMMDVGYQPDIAFISNATAFPQFSTDMEGAEEGILGAISWHESFPTTGNQDFVQRFFETYEGMDQIPEDAANAFTVGQVLQQAVEATGTLDNAVLVDYMHNNSFDTIVGELSFDECGRPQGYFHVFQWQSGRFEIVWPEEASTAERIDKPEW